MTFRPPETMRDPAMRAAWSGAMERIVGEFQPARVVLFGSQARGDARSDSDLDLLVLFDTLDDAREQRVAIRRALNHQPFAKDILVATTADAMVPELGSALAAAVREGVTVYER